MKDAVTRMNDQGTKATRSVLPLPSWERVGVRGRRIGGAYESSSARTRAPLTPSLTLGALSHEGRGLMKRRLH